MHPQGAAQMLGVCACLLGGAVHPRMNSVVKGWGRLLGEETGTWQGRHKKDGERGTPGGRVGII